MIYSDDKEVFDVIDSRLDDTLLRSILTNLGKSHLMMPASETILKLNISQLERIFIDRKHTLKNNLQ